MTVLNAAGSCVNAQFKEPVEEFSGCRITLVPQEHIEFIWPKVREMLAPAIERAHGRWTEQDVLDQLLSGKQFLWLAYRNDGAISSAVTTLISQYPSARLLGIQFAGGTDMQLWSASGMAVMKKFAADMGCSGIETGGRSGWGRYLERFGFKQYIVICEHWFEE